MDEEHNFADLSLAMKGTKRALISSKESSMIDREAATQLKEGLEYAAYSGKERTTGAKQAQDLKPQPISADNSRLQRSSAPIAYHVSLVVHTPSANPRWLFASEGPLSLSASKSKDKERKRIGLFLALLAHRSGGSRKKLPCATDRR